MIILSFLISIALHECGHVLMASWLGDNTPRAEGRQTLSFRPHIDPVGLLMCVILAFQPAFPVGLGWGKPVKPDPWKMKVKPDTGVLLVACAGIITSLLVGLIVTALLVFVGKSLQNNILGEFLLAFLIIFGIVNIAMAIFNLIPLYPLDGYQIVYTLLPSKQALKFARSAPYGPFIILIIFFFLPFIGNLTHASSFFLFHLSFYIWQVAALVMHLLGSPTNVPPQ
jgi:Zn-dependent protease